MVQLLQITPRKYSKLCWSVSRHLVELSVPYTLWYAFSKNDCVYFFSLLSSRCYSCHVRCLRRYNFLICETCLFFWMIVNNYLTTASWFRYHWLISQEIFIFWESEKLVFCCRFINAIKRLEFILWLKFTDSFEFLSSRLKEFFGDIKLCSLWIWKSVAEGFNCCSRHFWFFWDIVWCWCILLVCCCCCELSSRGE